MTNFSQWKYKKRDEYYTPKYLVKPILKYLKPKSTVWCPFDTKNSEYVKVFIENNFKVIHSHIVDGFDFFNYEPDEPFDYIISNPPFSMKKQILERLFSLNKPFAMLLGLPILNYNEIQNVFINNESDIQLLMFNKKATFDGNPSSFNSSYFCRNILPKAIICENLTIKFEESRMEKDRIIIENTLKEDKK